MLFKRNLINPVIKDTIRVPRFSTIGLRFIANNPGNVIIFILIYIPTSYFTFSKKNFYRALRNIIITIDKGTI